MIAIVVATDLALLAAWDRHYLAYDIFAIATLLLIGRTLLEAAGAMGALQRAIKHGVGDQK
jgi:hypothetical protein